MYQVYEIECSCFSQPWSVESLIGEVIRNDAASYVVAEDNGKIVGYAGMWQMFDEAHMTNIAVAAEYRCRGIATNLILCLMRTAKANGGKRMTLEVREFNPGRCRSPQSAARVFRAWVQVRGNKAKIL